MPDGSQVIVTPAAPEFLTRAAPPVPQQTRADDPPPVDPPATDPPPADDAAAEIRGVVAAAIADSNVADEVASALIAAGATVAQTRAHMASRLATRSAPLRTPRLEVGPSHDAPAIVLDRMSEALFARIAPAHRPSEAARPYMHRTLLELAGELLTRGGERIAGLSRDALLRRAMHTTSDFPTLLSSAGNRVLMAAYEAAPNPLKLLARQTTVTDFRAKTSVRLGGLPRLQKVNEHGEVKSTTRAEAKEDYRIATFAQMFSISRQAIINDDLGAFGDTSAAMGRSAAETEAQELVALLLENTSTGPTMDDGNPLFHSSHANVAGSGGAINATATLPAARLAMRTQTGLAGEPINATPKVLLVSPTKETEAETVLAAITPAQTSNVNVFSGKLDLAVEARLSGNRWWLFSDPAVSPVLEYAYLSSAQGPQVASREGWDVLGMEFRVTLDFGCGAVDWRGAYMNPGA